jgi:hypothetical protein
MMEDNIWKLMDDFSRKTFSYLLKLKDEVKTEFEEFRLLVENETNKIKTENI